ncbi:glycosyltransferase family 1 protein [Epilithonimonas vandammei]|uniref:Glycosyltransferase family 1 protein n=1 Tax=Epilithonimonas vandammei TaxID=2487072 RepID=A0A3G8ZHQ6_9FLAO|nr:glycosyltransferase [Epilithonimonas vandammei]AZI56187.1 glycosyltransferase family 1 protein [Epilithonimonas vandammei]
MSTKNFGLNISGYINKQFGLGEGVRSNIRAIQTTDVPYVINDFNITLSKHVKDDDQNKLIVSEKNPYNINLVQINIDRLHSVMQQTDKSYFENKYNIAFWAWELENFPEESKLFFSLFNEIWVPSNFCTEAISKVSPVPVIKMMHSIEIEKPLFTRKDFNLSDNKFIFMTMFDYYSSFVRKNPIATIDAYENAFGKNNSEVILLIKTSISQEFPEDKKLLIDRIGDNKSIIIIEEILERNKLYSLMNCCDCFVSLHRSEGFGLTMAEAMHLGKPVIATAYSANTEFMNINNSFLVKYNLIKTGDQYYYSTEKDIWADADIYHCSEQMKLVYENRELASDIALRGQKDVKEFLSPQVIGNKIKNRLEIINKEIIPNLSQKTSTDESLLKFEIKLLEEKLNKIRSLKPVQWKIKFKNFQNKLRGRNRKYFWE